MHFYHQIGLTDKFCAVDQCLCVGISQILLLLHKRHKDIDIDSIITECAHLKGRHLAPLMASLLFPFRLLTLYCTLLITMEMGKINNLKVHFPSYLSTVFKNILGEHAPDHPHPQFGAPSALKIFLWVHLKKFTLRPCTPLS